MIDLSKIKPGDEVTVRVKVDQKADDGDIYVCSKHGASGWFNKEEIATHTPKPRDFKPGDSVTWGNGTHVYEFIAQRGKYAVTWNETFGFSPQLAADLRHADESE